MNNQQTAGATVAVAVGARSLEATEQQKRLAISLISGCHTLNHLQYSITSVIFPVMMKELGFGLLQLGMLSAISNFVGQGLQVIYGFFAGFFKRTVVLGVGNVIVGLSAMSQFFVGSYPQLLAARVAIDAGSSPQHPLGASILSRYFSKARGWALTFHHSAGSLGSFIGPALASIALLYLDWRTVFVVFGAASLVMGLTLFMLRDHASTTEETSGKKRQLQSQLGSVSALSEEPQHRVHLHGANGGSGRTRDRYQYNLPGPLLYGTVRDHGIRRRAGSDRIAGRRARRASSDRLVFGSFRQTCRITQVTLLLSAIMTVWLAHQTSLGPLFYLNLILYGTVVEARGSLTQTMISDFAKEELTDAAFSIYYFIGCISGPIWTLIVGYVMERYGFTQAFYVAASTYIAGMLLLTLVKEESARSAKV